MLYQSLAGSILSVVVHSLLIMPSDIVKPLLPSFQALLPSIEKLNQVLPAAVLLEEQELEWPVKGKKKSDDDCKNDNPDDYNTNNNNSNNNQCHCSPHRVPYINREVVLNCLANNLICWVTIKRVSRFSPQSFHLHV